ncbi:MAG: acyl-CoA dehydrogenase C-terminal domain-containing protein, partial [Burkholderiaceae bacterium]
MRATADELAAVGCSKLSAIHAQFVPAIDAYEQTVDYVVANFKDDIRAVFAGSVPYLMLAGTVHGGWQLARAALVARAKKNAGEDVEFHQAKVTTARFYAEHILPRAAALKVAAVSGALGTLAMEEAAF